MNHALVGTRGPSGREVAEWAEGFARAAVSDGGHRSLGGSGGCCDIDIVRDLRIGDGDAGVVGRYDGTGVADR
jgi:hypothetical protein